jgi:hypothetical protein
MDLFTALLQSSAAVTLAGSVLNKLPPKHGFENEFNPSSSSSSSSSSSDVTEELVSSCVRSNSQLEAVFTRIETALCNILEQRLYSPQEQLHDEISIPHPISTSPANVGHGFATLLNQNRVSNDLVYRAIREEAQLWRLADRLWTTYEPKQTLLKKSIPIASQASCIGQARASFTGSAMEREVESSLIEYDGQIALAFEIKSWLEVSAEDDLFDLSQEVTMTDDLLNDIDLRSGFGMWREAAANAKVRGIGAKKSLELDPDALFRRNCQTHNESDEILISSTSSSVPLQLSSVDEHEENELLSLCWCFIRAGQLDKALLLCSQRGQPWLASMLLGSHSWSDEKEDISNDSMEIEQQIVRKGNPFSCSTLAATETAASWISTTILSTTTSTVVTSNDLKKSLLLFAAKKTAHINNTFLLSTYEDKLWAKTVGILDSAFAGHKLRQRLQQARSVPKHIPLAYCPNESDSVFVAHVGVSEVEKHHLQDLTNYSSSFDLISSLFGPESLYDHNHEIDTDNSMVDIESRPLPLFSRLAEGLCRIALSRAAMVDYKHGGRSPPISTPKEEISNFIRGPAIQSIPVSFDHAIKANRSSSSYFFEPGKSDDTIRDDSRLQLSDTELPLLRFSALATIILRDREEVVEKDRLVRGLTSIAGIDGDVSIDPVDEAADDIIYAFARHLALSPDQHGCRHAEAILALSARMKSQRRAIRLLVSLLAAVPFQGQVPVSHLRSEEEVDGANDDALLPDRFELIRAARIVALELSETGKEVASKNFTYRWREALKQTSLMQALDSLATLQRSSSLARGVSMTRDVSMARGASLTRDGRSASISSKLSASTYGVNDSFSSASGIESMNKLAVPMPRFPPVIKRVGVTMIDWMRLTSLQYVTEVDLRRLDTTGGPSLMCDGDKSSILSALAIANALSRLLLPRNPFLGLVAADDTDVSVTVKARAFVASLRFIWGDEPFESCNGCTWMGTEKGGLLYTLVSRALLDRASLLFSSSTTNSNYPPQVIEAFAWRSFAHAAVHLRDWADSLSTSLPTNEPKPVARIVSSTLAMSTQSSFSSTTSLNTKQPSEDTFNAFGSAITAAAMSAKNAEIENNWLRKQELSAGSALQAVLQASSAANRAYMSLCTCLNSGAGWLHDSVGIDGINCDIQEQVVDYASRDKLIPKADDFRFLVRRRVALLLVEVPVQTAKYVKEALPLLKNHLRDGSYESEIRDNALNDIMNLLKNALSGPVANPTQEMYTFLGLSASSPSPFLDAIGKAKEIHKTFNVIE